jgi:hypothetical protein
VADGGKCLQDTRSKVTELPHGCRGSHASVGVSSTRVVVKQMDCACEGDVAKQTRPKVVAKAMARREANEGMSGGSLVDEVGTRRTGRPNPSSIAT